jgi:N-acetyl-anhydromuramyl-L-alanine amidase AmpD
MLRDLRHPSTARRPEVPYPLVPSPHRTRAPSRTITTVVIHTMEIPERPGAARRCAAWFASEVSEVSAHYCVDAEEIVQCVDEADIAWHARGGNASSIGIELAGYAGQSAADWADRASAAIVTRAAELVADICSRHGVPVRRVRASGLRSGAHGITGHADVSVAFRKSDHWDPGPAFPWAAFLRQVREAQGVAV